MTPLAASSVGLLGLPSDENSSFERGAALAPGVIRAALHSPGSGLTTECGPDLAGESRFVDLGDLPLAGQDLLAQIAPAIATAIRDGGRLLCLGGDHAVTHPVLAAYGDRHRDLTVLHIDAHPDLYDSYDGNRNSHASPFARAMERGNIKRLVQIGIRTLNDHQRSQASKFGVEIVPRAQWLELKRLKLSGPVYLSIDLDGLDPAFAPGVSHPEPGGLTTREVLDILWNTPGLVGADVVELNPTRDVSDITAALAAKLVKELVARMLAGA